MTIDKTQNFSNFLHDETQVQSFMAHDLFHNNMTEISKLTHDSIEDFGIDDLGFTSTHDSTYHLMTKNVDIMTQNLINIFNIDIWIFLQNWNFALQKSRQKFYPTKKWGGSQFMCNIFFLDNYYKKWGVTRYCPLWEISWDLFLVKLSLLCRK